MPIKRYKTLRDRRRARIRSEVRGMAKRPRLSVFRSLKHIYAQLIDDVAGETLAAALGGGNVAAATKVGQNLAKKARELGIKKVVFDRGGYKYHGRVKALADGAREGGLEF